MKRLLTFLLLGILILNVVGATKSDLGVFKRGDPISLRQVCGDCTYNNITSVVYPNSSIILSHVAMTKSRVEYNYTLAARYTDFLGEYIVNGVGDLGGDSTAWVYTFEVTGTGVTLTTQNSIFYIFMVGLLIFLFIIILIFIPKLPAGNETDEEGRFMSINWLKHLKPIFLFIEWLLVLSIVYVASNLALAYLGTNLIGTLLFRIFGIMMGLTLPIIVIWFIWVFLNIIQDLKLKKMMERGLLN